MTFFLLIILGIFVWLFVIPIWRARRQWKEMQNQYRQFFAGRQDPNHNAPKPPAPQKNKKIDPSVGEYVEFTETTVSSTSKTPDGETSTTTQTESQITDITWEDIPS